MFLKCSLGSGCGQPLESNGGIYLGSRSGVEASLSRIGLVRQDDEEVVLAGSAGGRGCGGRRRRGHCAADGGAWGQGGCGEEALGGEAGGGHGGVVSFIYRGLVIYQTDNREGLAYI